MTHKHLLFTLSIVSTLTMTGCPGRPVYLSEIQIRYTAPMVAQKLSTPVFIILDPNDVPDQMTAEAVSSARPVEVNELRTFISRDLKNAFLNYFEKVEVGPYSTFSEPHVLVKVKITSLSTGRVGAGFWYASMQWAIAITHTDMDDYLLSISDRAGGDFPGRSIFDTDDMFRSTFQKALSRFFAEFHEEKILDKIRFFENNEAEDPPPLKTASFGSL